MEQVFVLHNTKNFHIPKPYRTGTSIDYTIKLRHTAGIIEFGVQKTFRKYGKRHFTSPNNGISYDDDSIKPNTTRGAVPDFLNAHVGIYSFEGHRK